MEELIEKGLGVTLEDCKNRSRKVEVVRLRAAAMLLLSKSGFNFVEIGKLLDLDRTTVMHHVKNTRRGSETYRLYRAARKRLKDELQRTTD